MWTHIRKYVGTFRFTSQNPRHLTCLRDKLATFSDIGQLRPHVRLLIMPPKDDNNCIPELYIKSNYNLKPTSENLGETLTSL